MNNFDKISSDLQIDIDDKESVVTEDSRTEATSTSYSSNGDGTEPQYNENNGELKDNKTIEEECGNNSSSISSPVGRRRRLSVSTIASPIVNNDESGPFAPCPSDGKRSGEADEGEKQYTDGQEKPSLAIDLSCAETAITRDETIATPKRLSNDVQSRPSGTGAPQMSKREALLSSSVTDDRLPTLAQTLSSSNSSISAPKRGRRLSVSGRMPGHDGALEANYQSKKVAVKHSQDFKMEILKDQLAGMGIGYACHKGLKPESPNQDDFFIIRIDEWGLYGVFDGHGPFGHDVSNFVQREFPKQLYGPEFLAAKPDRISDCMKDGFEKVQQRLEAYCNMPNVRTCATLSGTTASVVYHRIKEKRLVCAHVGDSRVVIGRRLADGSWEAEELARDHKPDNEEERRRITAHGGVVRRIAGDIPHRVFLQGKMFPGLAMSRALGDLIGHKAGVICTPEVTDYHIKPEDEFLILASDGIWEFIDSQECVEKVASYGRDQLAACVEDICSDAWSRWKREEGNVVDDITLELIYLGEDVSRNQQGAT